MIPHLIHWLWLGSDPVPDILTYYTDTWRQHHPAWETRLWRDETLSALSGLADFDQVTGFKKRYDILRLEIVRQYGGVIVDMDVEAVRPLDPLLAGVSGFIGRVNANHVGNQILGAVPHHPFFEEAVVRLRATIAAEASSSESAGKSFLKQLLTDRPDGMTVFPPEVFHFQPSFEPPRRPEDFPRVYAVHHELASYVAPPPAGAIEAAATRLIEAALACAGTNPKQQARLRKCGGRLLKMLAQQARGQEAMVRRDEAAREQAEARRRAAGRSK